MKVIRASTGEGILVREIAGALLDQPPPLPEEVAAERKKVSQRMKEISRDSKMRARGAEATRPEASLPATEKKVLSRSSLRAQQRTHPRPKKKRLVQNTLLMCVIVTLVIGGANYLLHLRRKLSPGRSSSRVDAPPGWQKTTVEPEGEPTIQIFESPLEGPGDGFQERIFVVSGQIAFASPHDLEKSFSGLLKGVSRNATKLVLLEQKRITIRGMRAKRGVFAFNEEGIPVKALGYVFARKNSIGAVMAISTPTDFSRFEKTFDDVARSFTFN
jgi:hypothetical protein